jgi:hypothetical protein
VKLPTGAPHDSDHGIGQRRVTGSRQSWLKSNGEIREFDSLTEAKQVAAELNATMKGPAGVTIRYEAIESEEL